MKPLISVVIPNYNYGKYLEETVTSILAQTFSDYEIIIVDDGSTDPHTLQVLRKIGDSHPEIKIIRQKNGHLSNARNNGIKASQGEFFLPLDSDDTIEPTMLEKCYAAISVDSKLGFVYTYTHFFGSENRIWRNQKYNFYNLLFANHPTVCALVRKKAWKEVGGYDENMKDGYEDWEFWIRLGKAGWFGGLVKEPLFNYRRHGKSMIDDSELKHNRIMKYIREKHKDLYTRKSLKKIKNQWKSARSDSGFKKLQEKLEAAGAFDKELWKKHPLRGLGRLIPVRIKRRINALLGKKIFDTSYYRRSSD